MIWLNLWYLPPAFLIAGGPRARPSPGIPCALFSFGGRFARQLGRYLRRENANSYPLCCLTFKSEDTAAVVPDKLAGSASARAASADPGTPGSGRCEERYHDHLAQRFKPVVMGPRFRGDDETSGWTRRASKVRATSAFVARRSSRGLVPVAPLLCSSRYSARGLVVR